jgi:transposase-like protein
MKREKPRKFSEAFKRKVVSEVIEGKLSKESARRVYGIRGKSGVLNWIRRFSDSVRSISQIELTLGAMTPQEREQFEVLKRKIAELEKQLGEETHRSGLYKTMIEIAETQLNIPIRKKYGARQCKPTKSTPKK